MSDETRTVTVESLAAALRNAQWLDEAAGNADAQGRESVFLRPNDARAIAAMLRAALPVATAGPAPRACGCVHVGPCRESECGHPESSHPAAALRGAAAQADGGEPAEWIDLAADIRAVDGNHDLGAGALAEALTSRGWSRAAAPRLDVALSAVAALERNVFAVCKDCTAHAGEKCIDAAMVRDALRDLYVAARLTDPNP